jgi:hypothetical protein
METNLIIDWLDSMYPDRLPFNKVSEYELGVLVGQRNLIEQLKIKLKISKPIEEEIK